MTSHDISRFIEAAAEDPALQSEWNAAETPKDLVGVGKRHGYRFDARELEAALASLHQQQRGELGEADLERVAGGLSLSPTTLSPIPKNRLQFYEGWPCKWL